MEGDHLVGGWARGSGKLKSTSRVQGQSPGGGLGDEVPQKPKQNVKLANDFKRFPVQNLRFNEYRSRAWAVSFANTQFKKILRI